MIAGAACKEEPNFHREAALDTKGYANIPDALFEAITFLAQALPKRSAPAWLELLFGALSPRPDYFGIRAAESDRFSTEGQMKMLASTAPWRAKQHATRR